ncbi:MAG: ANTAR domain-containing protein [Rhodococcus sp. (in: high G+C Gram-positive bacteria)]
MKVGAALDVSADEAFHRLAQISQRTNTKLSDVARNLMASITDTR